MTYLLTAVYLLAAAPLAKAAEPPRIRVSVSAGAPAAEGPPAVFGYSGNIWRIPEAFAAGVPEQILGMRRLGIARISLGDEVLADATSLQDLQQRLTEYPLNDFLRRYVAAGGKVLFILDGTPRWLSADKSTQKIPGPDQPAFRISPPADDAEWSSVVETVVRHFNGRLGLNAYYEAWNEPN
jgi:hypothetical protein